MGLIFNSLIPKNTYQLLWCPSTTLICFQFKHLHNPTDKSFAKFKDAYHENGANKTLPGAQETWRHIEATPLLMLYWVQPAWVTEPTLLTSTLPMGGPTGQSQIVIINFTLEQLLLLHECLPAPPVNCNRHLGLRNQSFSGHAVFHSTQGNHRTAPTSAIL